MNESLEHMTTLIAAALLRASWQGGVVIAIVWGLERTLTLPAAWRSWLWRIVFVKLALSLVVASGVSLPILPASRLSVSSAAVGEETSVADATTAFRSSSRVSGVTLLLVAGWAAGVGLAAAWQYRAARRVRRELRWSRPLHDHTFRHALLAAAERLGLRQVPEVRVIDAAGGPRLIGSRRPILLAPRDWLANCSTAQMRLAATHELGHIVRRDLIWNRLAVFCQSVFFFHPLVRLAAHRYSLAQEIACDEVALRQADAEPGEFARMLLHLATVPAGTAWDGSVAMTGAGFTLRERILAMDRSQWVRRPSRAAGWLVALAVGAAVVPFSFAQQSVKSPSEKGDSVKKKSSETKPGASASAAAFGFAEGAGNGAVRAQAKATAAVGEGATTAPGRKSVESPNDAPPKSRANSKVSGNMRAVQMEQTNGRIRVVTNENGVETVTEAGDMEELRKKSPAAFETLRKFMKEGAEGAPAFPGKLPDGIKLPEGFKIPEGFNVPDGIKLPEGFQIPDGGGVKLPEGFQLPNGAAGAKDAFKQFRQAIDAAGVGDPAIGKFFDDFENELENE